MDFNIVLTGKINENLLMEAIPVIFTELLKKYTALDFAKHDLKTMHWDENDESHIYALKFYWEYSHGDPKVLEDELNDQIAFQSGQLFHELKCWIQRFADHNQWKQVYSYDEHVIFARQGDTLEIHSDDNHIYITIHLSGQW